MTFTLFFIFGSFFNFTFAVDNNDVVAVVNGNKITVSQLNDYHAKNLSFVRAFKKISIETSLDDLINREIGIERAKKMKIAEEASVQEKINDLLFHSQLSKDLEDKLLKIRVTDKEVEDFYKENPEYNTAQILFRLPVEPKPEDVSVALSKADKLYEEIVENKGDFQALASKYSEADGAATGGELGFQPRTRLTPEYYESIKNKKINFITKPFRTQYGFHIVKVLGVKEYKQIDDGLYKKIIYDIKRDSIIAQYFSDLRKKAKIQINKKTLEQI